jgi:hypothetical protein
MALPSFPIFLYLYAQNYIQINTQVKNIMPIPSCLNWAQAESIERKRKGRVQGSEGSREKTGEGKRQKEKGQESAKARKGTLFSI